MKDNLKSVLLCLLISLGTSITSIAAYHQWFAVRIVAADTSGFLKQVREDYLNRNITPKELEHKLEQMIALIRQQPDNKIILTADVVLSKNVETVTP
ncbi:MAG: hypothetical protein ACOZF0_21035 [Thermodesulfobacteriota bacterium]